MTAKDIQHALFAKFGNSSRLMIPNYTPENWFECDLFRVTKAGYAEEFEIKLSVADFKADAKKGPDDNDRLLHELLPDNHWRKQKFDGRTKHERLSAGDPLGPIRFWFAMPEVVAAKVEIPVWAGLVTFREHREHGPIMNSTWKECATFKRAPQLHRACCRGTIKDHALGVFYWRYWNLRQGYKEESGSTP